MTTKQFLNQGLHQLGICSDIEPLTEALMSYLILLEKWNRTYNLTAIRDIESMVTRHVLDSLAIAPWIVGKYVLDVGAGAGLPGIPLALLQPNWQITLLDSNGKKIRFMQEVKRALKLDNITIEQTRVEQYYPKLQFDTITSRAFTTIQQMIAYTKHLIAIHGNWVIMKGRYPNKELATITLPFQVQYYKVPGLDEERCCVLLTPNSSGF